MLFFVFNFALAQNAVVITLPDDIVYSGIEIPVKITMNGKELKADDYTVKSNRQPYFNRASYRKTDSCLWIKPAKNCKEELSIIGKNGEILGQKNLLSRCLPDFAISLDHLYGGHVARETISAALGLLVDHDYTLPFIPPKYVISSYRLIMTIGNETRTFDCKGPLITDTIRYYLNHLKIPWKLEFTNITCDSACYNHYNSQTLIFSSDDYDEFYHEHYGPLPIYDTVKNRWDINPGSDIYPRPDKIVETNCNYSGDTCTTKVYFVLDGKRSLAFRYEFRADQSERYQWFFKRRQLSDRISYKNGPMTETTNDTDGMPVKEESYSAGKKMCGDTFYRVHPVTDKIDTGRVQFPCQVKDGVWKYYEHGQLAKTETYLNDTLIEEKRYKIIPK